MGSKWGLAFCVISFSLALISIDTKSLKGFIAVSNSDSELIHSSTSDVFALGSGFNVFVILFSAVLFLGILFYS